MKTTLIATSCFVLIALGAPSLHASEVKFPGSVPVLLANQSVREDLALTKPQCSSLDRLRAKYKSDARAAAARFPATAAERKAANATLRELNARYNASALSILTPAQRERLDQIGHQKLGGLMLFVPRIQQKLQLTTAQVSALGALQREGDAFADKANRAFEDGKIGIHERLEALRKWRIKQSAKILSVLTKAQKCLLHEMQGQQLKPA
ncbi:MAG: hypothetical protein WCS65_07805 [Verrucomicrobiae bacterium]